MAEGDVFHNMKVTPELMEEMVARDIYGNLVTIDWGEPDEAGFYQPMFTVHYDENIVVDELKKLQAAIDRLKQPVLGLKGGVARRDIERIIQARTEGRPWHPVIPE